MPGHLQWAIVRNRVRGKINLRSFTKFLGKKKTSWKFLVNFHYIIFKENPPNNYFAHSISWLWSTKTSTNGCYGHSSAFMQNDIILHAVGVRKDCSWSYKASQEQGKSRRCNCISADPRMQPWATLWHTARNRASPCTFCTNRASPASSYWGWCGTSGVGGKAQIRAEDFVTSAAVLPQRIGTHGNKSHSDP